MLIRRLAAGAVALVVLYMAAPLGRTAALDDEAQRQEVARLIDALDAEDFGVRERAQRSLVELGPPVLPLLKAQIEEASAEQRARLAKVASAIGHGTLMRDFAEFGRLADERLEVERGMWLIARIFDPEVTHKALSRSLDDLAQEVRVQAGALDPKAMPPRDALELLVKVLSEDAGLQVNRADFDDPDNSSIHRVLQRGKGLQIILSEIAVAVGRRLELPLEGVSVSSFYAFRYDRSKAPGGVRKMDIVVDPFRRWQIAEDAGGRMRATHPTGSPARATLDRMLNNLAKDFAGTGDVRREGQVREYQALLNGIPGAE